MPKPKPQPQPKPKPNPDLGLCLQERVVDGGGAVGFAPCEEAGTSWHVLAGRAAEMRSLRGESGLCLQRKLYTSR